MGTPSAHLCLLHGLLQVVVDPANDVGVEPRQGKQGGRRGRRAERVDLPGELRPDPERFVEKAVSFCRETTAAKLGTGWAPPHLPGHWVPCFPASRVSGTGRPPCPSHIHSRLRSGRHRPEARLQEGEEEALETELRGAQAEEGPFLSQRDATPHLPRSRSGLQG